MKKIFTITVPFVFVFIALYLMSPWFNQSERVVDSVTPPIYMVEQEAKGVRIDDVGTEQIPKMPVEDGGSIENIVAKLLKGGYSGSEYYGLLRDLLDENETAFLLALSKVSYPVDDILDSSDTRSGEVEMLTRAFKEVYAGQILEDVLIKLEVIEQTGLLYQAVVTELIGQVEGWENTNTAYNWILANPETLAARQSGISVGGKLADFDRDSAWDKVSILQEGRVRSGAMSSVLSSIASSDMKKAELLIRSFEPTKDLDRSISNLVAMKLRNGDDHAQTLKLAIASVDMKFRTSTTTVLLIDWARTDANQLRSWLKNDHPEIPTDRMAEIRLFAKQALTSFSAEN